MVWPVRRVTILPRSGCFFFKRIIKDRGRPIIDFWTAPVYSTPGFLLAPYLTSRFRMHLKVSRAKNPGHHYKDSATRSPTSPVL